MTIATAFHRSTAVPHPRFGPDALLTAQSAAAYLTSFLIAAFCMAVLVAAFQQLFAPLLAALSQRAGTRAWLDRASRSVSSSSAALHHLEAAARGRDVDTAWLMEALQELGVGGDGLLKEASALVERAVDVIVETRRRNAPYWLPRPPWMRAPDPIPLTGAGVSDEQFAYGVQNEARAAVAHPSERTVSFLLATAGTSLWDVATPLLAIDLLSIRKPEAAMRLGTAGETSEDEHRHPALVAAAAAIAALDEQVARVVERRLDDLQRVLIRRRAWTTRAASISLGLAGSAFGGLVLDLPSDVTVWSIGTTGGVLAILLREGLTAAVGRSSR